MPLDRIRSAVRIPVRVEVGAGAIAAVAEIARFVNMKAVRRVSKVRGTEYAADGDLLARPLAQLDLTVDFGVIKNSCPYNHCF